MRTDAFQLLKEVQHILSHPHMRCRSEPLYMYRLPFSFMIPSELISARSDIGPEFLRLCPSANLGSTVQNSWASQIYSKPSIKYTIRVKHVTTDVHLVPPHRCYMEREIQIMPYTSPLPPLVLEHFPNDFRTFTCSSIRTRQWKQSFGVLELSAVEPPPLNLCTAAPRACTLASLQVILRQHGCCSPELYPCNWKFTIRSYIRIRTFCSTQTLTKVPTMFAAKINPCLNVNDSRTFSETRQYCVSSWKYDPQLVDSGLGPPTEGEGVTDGKAPLWCKTLVVPISAPKALLPTFLNPLSARQYALVLKVDVEGLSHRPLKLVLPLQVIYWPDGMRETVSEQTEDPPPFIEVDLTESLPTSESGNEMRRSMSRSLSPPPYEI